MTTFKLPEGVPKKVKPKKLHERESVIEEYLRTRAAAHGDIAYKFTSPQRRSVPDRLVLGDVKDAVKMLKAVLKGYGVDVVHESTIEDEAAIIVAEMVRFVELKATGEKPTPLQEREHAKLRARGFRVDVIDSKAEVDRRYPK